MWLFEKETNDKISLKEKYLPSTKMHEYVPEVLETIFEAEWLRCEDVFFFSFFTPWKKAAKGSREWSRDDAFESKLQG